jgi:HEAT repeat protein
MIRLATCEILKDPLPPDFWEMIDRGLRARDFHRRWAARDALGCAPDREKWVIHYLSDTRIPQAARQDIIDQIRMIFSPDDRCLAFIRKASVDPRLDRAAVVKLSLWGAIMGETAMFEALVEQIPSLSAEDIGTLADMLAEYPSREHGQQLVSALASRAFKPSEKVSIAAALMLGARHKLDRHGLRSAGLESCPPHAAIDAILALIDDWRKSTEFSRVDALGMETIATEAGLDGAAERLLEITKTIASEEEVGGYYNPFNSPVRSALSALQDRGLSLPLDLLERLIDTASSNARIGAIYMIGSIGTRAALDFLLELSRRDREDWSSVFQNVEKLAARLNLEVIRTTEGLVIGQEIQPS